MSMPALQALKRARPDARVHLLVKPHLLDLWGLHRSVDDMVPLERGPAGTVRTARRLRKAGCGQAFVFPNSFRSAWLPFLAGVPGRVGARGHQRAWLLDRVVDTRGGAGRRHQAREYFRILGLDEPDVLEGPRLDVPRVDPVRLEAFGLQAGTEWVGVIPGAARGPAKQWGAEKFVAVGEALVAGGDGRRVLVLGTAAEAGLCTAVAAGIGPAAVTLAGRTSLPELAGLLAGCRVVVSNDSGGMHLAAAAGTRVVAVYGTTDPEVTGPLGEGHRIVSHAGVERSRDIKPNDPAARAALNAIHPDEVRAAVAEVLA
jgi:heptosyltransferase-2